MTDLEPRPGWLRQLGTALRPHRRNVAIALAAAFAGQAIAAVVPLIARHVIDDVVVATLADVRAHPATFGLSGGGVQVGRNSGQPVCAAYTAPFEFTGGTIAKVVVDVSGTPYIDRERELALAFARD